MPNEMDSWKSSHINESDEVSYFISIYNIILIDTIQLRIKNICEFI